MTMKTGLKFGAGIVVAAIALSCAGPASAQTYVWTNAQAGTQWWSSNANWTVGTAPAAGGAANYTLIFSNSAAANVANNDLTSPFMLNNLRFQLGAMSLAGGTLLFTNNGATMPVISNMTGGARTIANDVVFGTNISLGGNSFASALRFTGAASLGGGSRTVSVAHIQNVYVPSIAVLGGAVGDGGLIKAGNGTLILSGANTYAGGTRVAGGVLQFDSAGAIGGSGANVTNFGGAINLNFSSFMDAATNRIGLISRGSLGVSEAFKAEAVDFRPALFSNAFLAAATGRVAYALENHTPYVNAAATGSNIWKFGGGGGILDITNSITGGDTVVIGGGGNYGAVRLAGTNSYTGATIVQDGMLLIVSNSTPSALPSVALGATSRIIVSNGTINFASVIVTNPIYFTLGGNNAQNNGATIQLTGGTTNLFLAPITFIQAPGWKINGGPNATGLHVFAGGIISTNQSPSFYDDVGNNRFIFTNQPIRLGTGVLTGKNHEYWTPSNVVGGLSYSWGSATSGRGALMVDDAFVGAISLSMGTPGYDTINWLDLNGHNLTLRSMFVTGNVATAYWRRQFITSIAPGSLLTLTNGPGDRIIYDGFFTGQVNLVKSGTGILELRGTNVHTGTTTIQNGTVILSHSTNGSGGQSGLLTASAVTVTNGTLLINNTTTAIGNLSGLQVVGGGAIGTTGTLDQAFVDWAYGNLTANPAAFALSANNANTFDFADAFEFPSFLGAAPISNMVFTGSASWGDTTNRLGGGGGKLIYMPAIGAGTNLLVGPAGGNLEGGVVLLTANAHDRTTIQSGSLFITNDAALGAVPVVPGQTNLLLNGGALQAVSNNVSLHVDRDIILGPNGGGLGADTNRTLYVSQVVAGGGALTKLGAGTVALGGANTYTGGTYFLAGTLNVSNDAALGAAGDGASVGGLVFNGGLMQVSGSWTNINRAVTLLGGGGGFNVDTTRVFGVTNTITGVGGLLKTGMGTLVLPGSNSYSGGTIVSGIFERNPNSTVRIGNNDALGTGGIVLTNGGVLRLSGDITVTNALLTYGGDQSTSYSGALVSDSGNNIWGGNIVVTTASTRISVFGGSLRITNGVYGNQVVNFSVPVGSLTIDTVPILSTSGQMLFSGPGGVTTPTGTNYLNVAGSTFGGVQIWQSGLLVAGVENALPTNGYLYIGDMSFQTAGTLDLNGFNQTVGNLFSGTNFFMRSFVTNRSATAAILTVNQTANTNYLGVFAGNMGFVKRGGGSLILAGSNSHTLGTTVAGGTLHVTNDYALGAPGDGAALGGLVLTNGGGLRTSGSFTLANRAVSIAAGGGFITTDAGTWLTITNPVSGIGNLAKNSDGTLELGGATTVSNFNINAGRVVNTGAMKVNATNDLGLRIFGSAVVSNSGSINVTPGKIQLYQNGRLDNTGPVTNSTGLVLSEAGTAGLTVVNNLPGGQVQMNGGTTYVGLYYPGTFNNSGGDVTLASTATLLVGGPSWATIVGSNTLGTLNVDGGLFNHSGSGVFQVGPSLGAPNGTGIVNVAGGVLAVNKAITKGNGVDAYGFFNFNGGTLSGTVNNVTLLGTDLSAVKIQAGGGRVSLAAGITNTISASLQNGGGGGGLTKDGAGVLRLTGASLYTGTTRVMGGVLDLVGSASLDNSTTLQIDAGATLMASNLASTLHLKTGQTLKGNGTFVGGLITDSGSTVAPGASAGVLTVAGNLTLSGGSTLSLELDGTTAGTQYDQLVLSGGSLTLGSPALDILLGFTPAYSDTFTIVSGLSGFDPGVNGIFSGKADGSSFTVGATEFQIDYNPSDITLTVIPEPVTTGLAGFVVLAGLLLRRRIR